MTDIKFLKNEFFQLISNYIDSTGNNSQKVQKYLAPHELRKKIDFSIHKEGISYDELLQYIKKYIEYAVNTGNPQFFNQLYAGFNMPAFMGEVVTALTNTSMYTYEVAPVATLIENELISKMCNIAGYTSGDGIFVTGGSNANLIAMFSARNKMFPNINKVGIYGLPKLSAFISEEAHYSFENNANLLGLGSSSIYKIKSDKSGKMLPKDLEAQILISINNGEKPFFIGATAGTTMLGAFDPIEEIVKIGEKFKIWVHVDGSFGASLILSSKAKYLFKGIAKTDSFAWNPHKLMNVPLVSSVILLKEKERLYKNLTNLNDDYIFHESESGSCDLGKKSIQCGRKVDALKLWTAWKFYGDNGYKKRIDKLLDIADYFEKKIKSDKRFELLAERQSLTVCFRYLPADIENVNQINENIREELRKSGLSIVNYGYLGDKFAFRWVVSNADVIKKDVDLFFENFLHTAEVNNFQTMNRLRNTISR